MSPGAVYLDFNAGAPVRTEVAEAMARALASAGNPSSVHRFGRLARRAVEDARALVARLAGAAPAGVVFTGGGTEANDLALRGRRLIVSAIEHDSVLALAPDAARVAVDRGGAIDLAALEAALAAAREPAVVSLMLANNETGVIQPVAEAAALAHAHGALLHCDAVQAPGRIVLDMAALGADLMSLSAHKFGGPQGVGALIVAPGIDIAPRRRGGGQESGRRAGTENVAGIVGFGVAAGLALDDLAHTGRIAALRDAAEARLLAIAPDATVFGAGAPRLPNTLCLTMPGVASETQVMALDLAGVAVSAGAACSSGKVGPSHVLAAMGSREGAAQAIRISLGHGSGMADIDRLVEAWQTLYGRARESAASPAASGMS